MGQQSEKKIAINKAKVIGFYLYPTLICSVLYLLSNLYSGDFFTISFLTVAFVQIVSYFCYTSISKSLDIGISYDSFSIYLDVLVLNLVVEAGSLLSDYFYYLYCIFPGILFYKLMKLCWGYATNIEYVDDGKGGPKRKEKKKEKVKVVRQ